jgi:hypothetical protein
MTLYFFVKCFFSEFRFFIFYSSAQADYIPPPSFWNFNGRVTMGKAGRIKLKAALFFPPRRLPYRYAMRRFVDK